MRRFFMTIPEAVQLVLQAAALGRGGEVFVLDMGEQVRIVDLATDLIRLSGLRPGVRMDDGERVAEGADEWDVEVVFTGVRPGEKLYEELFAAGEECRPTRHEKVLMAENGRGRLSSGELDNQVERLAELAESGDEAGVYRLLEAMVPEYVPSVAANLDSDPERQRPTG
jgi:FlaA1/EpsC-like NDP-sugar epimerase